MEDKALPEGAAAPHGIGLREAAQVWARIACLSFGGPAGQIALMHRILVEEKRWIGEARFLHALNFCMLLPGPEAQQLATYIGWLLHRTWGGLVAGTLFILPGALAILALSYVYVLFGQVPLVQGLFFGIASAVLAIVAQAVLRLGRRTLRSRAMLVLAAAAFIASALFGVPFPAVVAAAALIGLAGRFAGPGNASADAVRAEDRESALGETLPAHARPGAGWSLRLGAVFLGLWLAPSAVLVAMLGPDAVFTRLSLFFSQAALVTFGGAYAVLTYVADASVDTFGWLRPGEMVDALAMAEATPGPLIMAVQFVGFLAAFRAPGGLDPLLAATLGALLTIWVTFVPCFLWIFLGAPFAERLRASRALTSALAAVTAAVVGVILELMLWFAAHTLFSEVRPAAWGGLRAELPVLASVRPDAVALAGLAAVALLGLRWSVPAVLAAAGAAGMLLRLSGLP